MTIERIDTSISCLQCENYVLPEKVVHRVLASTSNLILVSGVITQMFCYGTDDSRDYYTGTFFIVDPFNSKHHESLMKLKWVVEDWVLDDFLPVHENRPEFYHDYFLLELGQSNDQRLISKCTHFLIGHALVAETYLRSIEEVLRQRGLEPIRLGGDPAENNTENGSSFIQICDLPKSICYRVSWLGSSIFQPLELQIEIDSDVFYDGRIKSPEHLEQLITESLLE